MSSINIQAQACVACKGRPSPENTPCAVCGTGQPAASAEPVGEIVLSGGDPDLKEVSWRNGKMPPPGTKLYTAPVAAQAQQDADKVDAERYRAWRDALITGRTSEHDFIRLVANSLPTSVGVSRRPTAAEWDAAIDAASKEAGQ